MPGGGYALSGLQTKRNFPGRGVPPYPGYLWHWATHCTGFVGPRKRSAAGHGHRQGTVFVPGGGYA